MCVGKLIRSDLINLFTLILLEEKTDPTTGDLSHSLTDLLSGPVPCWVDFKLAFLRATLWCCGSNCYLTARRFPAWIPVWPGSSCMELAWYSGFLPQSREKQICVTLFEESKLTIGVNGCLSLYVGPEICWWPVRGVAHISPKVCWDWLQFPSQPLRGFAVYCIYGRMNSLS